MRANIKRAILFAIMVSIAIILVRYITSSQTIPTPQSCEEIPSAPAPSPQVTPADPKFDIFQEIFDSIDSDSNIKDMEQKYEMLNSSPQRDSISIPKYKFVDDETSEYATGAVAQYMQKQLDAPEGMRSATPSGFNQLGAIRPTTALGEIISMPKLYTEFNLNTSLVDDTTDEYSEKFLRYRPMVNTKANSTAYNNMNLRKISSTTMSR